MIVVDLGCAPHEGERSVETLLERYDPHTLYGFDPTAPPGVVLDGAFRIYHRKAAWTYDGYIDLAVGGPNGLYNTIVPDYKEHDVWNNVWRVSCIDFAAWLLAHPEPTVVKMNIEGAEYALMEDILERGADAHVVEWLVAWHDDVMPDWYAARKEYILARTCARVLPWTIDDVTLCA